jgi:hypothetical protein
MLFGVADYREFAPPEALRPVVACLWENEAIADRVPQQH